jgi:hypothetical protein
MKNIFYLVVLFALLSSVHLYADEKQVPVEGKWGDERVRTLNPEVYINNNVLSIYLADTLKNLAIVVTDSNGSIVYQDIFSNVDSYTYTIWLSEQPCCYKIIITHSIGYLTGTFTVEL